MSRWFRHYAGMMRDDKLVRVAIRSKQTIERVAWVWGAILESAAEIDDAGRYDVDAAEIAYFLRADQDDVDSILAGLADAGRVDAGCVVKWSTRQFASDRSKERVAAHRERKRAENLPDNDQPTSHEADVTLQKRHGDAPETETDTEAEREASPAKAVEAKRGRKRTASIAFAFPDWVPQAEFDAFKRMRADIGHKITTDGIPLAVDRLAKLRDAGHDPAKVLNRSTMNSWRGLFPITGEEDPAPAKVTPIREVTAEDHDRMAIIQAERNPEKAAFHRQEAERARKVQPFRQLIQNAQQNVRATA